MRREDLLALDEGKLAELATRGHVKRARKEIARGRGPTIELEVDGTVVSTSADATARLAPGRPLSETRCTCSAPRVCHHRVMAVLAYRAAQGDAPQAAAPAWSPATLDDDALAAYLGPGAFRRARRRAEQGVVASVTRGPVPSASLPTCTVRFLVPGELGYARCDCARGPRCEHVALAVWAFREARGEDEDATVEVGGAPALEIDALEAAHDLARALLLDGAAGSGPGLAARFARAVRPLGAARLLWPRAICEELQATLESYERRAATYDPTRVGDLLTELHARGRAAARPGAAPPRAILGVDEPEETALSHLRLVSLGCRLERSRLDAQRHRVQASVFLADPDTRGVLVLERAWEVDPEEVGAALARRHVRADLSLGALARGQIVSKVARRRANHSLILGAPRGGLAQTSVTPQRGLWDRLGAPLYVEDFQALDEALRRAPPRFIRPRRLADHVRVARVEAVGEPRYDAATQTLEAPIRDRRGAQIWLTCTHSAAAPAAIDALRDALSNEARFVSGEVWRAGDGIRMRPLAVVTDRVRVIDLEPPPDARADRPTRRAEAPVDPLLERLASARECLDRGAHVGLRHVSAGWLEELAERQRGLEGAGLRGCAARAEALREALAAARGGGARDEGALARAWLDASLRVRLALEVG